MLNTKFLKKTFVSIITMLSMFLSCSFVNCSLAANNANSEDSETTDDRILIYDDCYRYSDNMIIEDQDGTILLLVKKKILFIYTKIRAMKILIIT